MRILQVWHKAPGGGGVAAHVAALARQLDARGHDAFELQLAEDDRGETAGRRGIYRLPWSYGPIRGQRLRPALRHILSSVKPDVVHLHGCFTALSAVLLSDLQRYAPVVGTLHDIRPFCYLMTRRFAPTGELCERRCGIGCFSSGCVQPDEIKDVIRLPRRWLMDALNLRQWRGLDRIVTPSAYLRDLALQHGMAAERLRLIPHGTTVAPSPEKDRIEADPPLLLFLGGLLDYKGPDLFVEALHRLRARPWQAILVGDGPMRATLEHAVERYGLNRRVRFYGRVDDSGLVDQLLARARLLAVPSKIPESFSLAGIEALARGTPVVSFGLGGLAEWLRDCENGLIANDGDVEDFTNKIEQLLDDPDRARCMGKRGHALVAREFTADLALERLLAVYAEVTSTSR